MPTIFLSPATYENPIQKTHHSLELAYIHALTDTLESHLNEANIAFSRNAADGSAQAAIDASNRGDYALHLALHANMAPDGLSGTLRGITVLHSAEDREGARAAALFSGHLKEVYPLPHSVRVEQNERIGQLTRVNHPSLLVILGYQDSSADAAWLQYRREDIANAIVRAVEAFLRGEAAESLPAAEAPSFAPALDAAPPADDAVPTAAPGAEAPAPRQGIVRAPFGSLVLRTEPEGPSPILAAAANGSQLTILDTVGDWYLLQFGNTTGYASRNFVAPL